MSEFLSDKKSITLTANEIDTIRAALHQYVSSRKHPTKNTATYFLKKQIVALQKRFDEI